MPEIKSFEDKFDHDPNSVREKDDSDWDLGPDDEFAEDHTRNRSWYPEKRKTPKSGCFGGLFKITLSLGMIALFYLYIFKPDTFTDLQNNVINLQKTIRKTVSSNQSGQAPVLSMNRTTPSSGGLSSRPAPSAEQRRAQQTDNTAIVLSGAGFLPDFTTVAKKKPSLNDYPATAKQLDFESLDTYHALVKNMIAEWTGETDEQKIAETVQMPYKNFFNRISALLLSQTVLTQAGLTPENSDRLISQSPVQAMALLYPKLRDAMATKTTVQNQIRTIEPVSSFLIYICRDEPECMASWDLLIDMLGAKQFSQRLEKAPETIYAEP